MKRRQLPGHTCLWTGCHVRVQPGFWGCGGHWKALPMQIRIGILKGYQQGRLSQAWLDAHQAALDWIAGSKERFKAAGMRGTGIDEPLYKKPKERPTC